MTNAKWGTHHGNCSMVMILFLLQNPQGHSMKNVEICDWFVVGSKVHSTNLEYTDLALVKSLDCKGWK